LARAGTPKKEQYEGFVNQLGGVGEGAGEGEKPSDEAKGGVAAFSFTVNYIFGAGVLGVPYAIAHAGIVVSSFFLAAISAMSCVAMIWVVEACGRGEAWVAAGQWQQASSTNLMGSGAEAGVKQEDLHANLIDSGEARVESPTGLPPALGLEPTYEITDRRLEVTELTEMFLGYKIKIAFDVSVTLFSVVTMWLYAVLFTVSMSQTFPLGFITDTDCAYDAGLWNVTPECRVLYWFYLAVFMGFMLMMAMLDLSGMVGLQKGLAGMHA